jgi:uncharacterized glyoxalase superfamily protein PhnB
MAEIPQGVTPMLAYEDGAAALDWLSRVFGFKERTRMQDKSGRLTHGEMETGHGVIMLASPTADYQGPRRHRDSCASAKKWSSVPYIIDGVMVEVDDVDAHFHRAKSGGALILSEPEDTPYGRHYRVEDLEGHRWMFLSRREETLPVSPLRAAVGKAEPPLRSGQASAQPLIWPR